MVALTCLARREPVRVLLRFKHRGCCACRARAGHLHGDASAAVVALTLPHSARASEGSVTTQAPWVLCMPGQCRPPAWRCLCCGGCVDAASLGASQSGLCYDSNTWVMCCFRTEPATCTSPPLRRRLRKHRLNLRAQVSFCHDSSAWVLHRVGPVVATCTSTLLPAAAELTLTSTARASQLCL